MPRLTKHNAGAQPLPTTPAFERANAPNNADPTRLANKSSGVQPVPMSGGDLDSAAATGHAAKGPQQYSPWRATWQLQQLGERLAIAGGEDDESRRATP